MITTFVPICLTLQQNVAALMTHFLSLPHSLLHVTKKGGVWEMEFADKSWILVARG